MTTREQLPDHLLFGAGHQLTAPQFETGENLQPIANACSVAVPSRVDTFLCRPDVFVAPPRPYVYPVCSVNFAIDLFARATVRLSLGNDVTVEGERPGIIRHAALLMKRVLGYRGGLTITANNDDGLRHAGLGSSAALQAAVASAIHTLFGEPFEKALLARFLSQNYGEEADEAGELVAHVPSIGGAATMALSKANLVVIGGECVPWYQGSLPETYKLVLALPAIAVMPDGHEDRKMLSNGHPLLSQMGQQWGAVREAILRRRIVPSLAAGVPGPMFDAINRYTAGQWGDIPGYFENRWRGSGWQARSFLRDLDHQLFKRLSRTDACMFVSSGGPAIGVITSAPHEVAALLRNFDCSRVEVREMHARGAMVNLETS